MSRALRGVIRIAAWSLPAGVKDRYREEWLADVAGAREAGIDASEHRRGRRAVQRDTAPGPPDVLGMPLTVAARRHARWGTALLLSALVFAFGSFLTGGFSSGSGGALAVAATVWGGLTAAATVLGLIALWRAALLASPLARIAAATLTTAAAAFASLTVIPQSSVVGALMVPIGLLLGSREPLSGSWPGRAAALSPRPRARARASPDRNDSSSSRHWSSAACSSPHSSSSSRASVAGSRSSEFPQQHCSSRCSTSSRPDVP